MPASATKASGTSACQPNLTSKPTTTRTDRTRAIRATANRVFLLTLRPLFFAFLANLSTRATAEAEFSEPFTDAWFTVGSRLVKLSAPVDFAGVASACVGPFASTALRASSAPRTAAAACCPSESGLIASNTQTWPPSESIPENSRPCMAADQLSTSTACTAELSPAMMAMRPPGVSRVCAA